MDAMLQTLQNTHRMTAQQREDGTTTNNSQPAARPAVIEAAAHPPVCCVMSVLLPACLVFPHHMHACVLHAGDKNTAIRQQEEALRQVGSMLLGLLSPLVRCALIRA